MCELQRLAQFVYCNGVHCHLCWLHVSHGMHDPHLPRQWCWAWCIIHPFTVLGWLRFMIYQKVWVLLIELCIEFSWIGVSHITLRCITSVYEFTFNNAEKGISAVDRTAKNGIWTRRMSELQRLAQFVMRCWSVVSQRTLCLVVGTADGRLGIDFTRDPLLRLCQRRLLETI